MLKSSLVDFSEARDLCVIGGDVRSVPRADDQLLRPPTGDIPQHTQSRCKYQSSKSFWLIGLISEYGVTLRSL